jgi:hypothetical protein
LDNVKIGLSQLRREKSGTLPVVSWKHFITQWTTSWRKFWRKTKTELNQQETPPVIKATQPFDPGQIPYFIKHGRRSYEKGITFDHWSDRMIIVHGDAVIPYLQEVWEHVNAQTFRTNSKQTMKTKLIITALAVFILTGIFPPWQYITDKDSVSGHQYAPPSQGVHSRKPAGYSWLFAPPVNPDGSAGNGVQIDFGRVFLEWAVLAAITGMVWMLVVKPVWSREDKDNRSQKFIAPPGNPGN